MSKGKTVGKTWGKTFRTKNAKITRFIPDVIFSLDSAEPFMNKGIPMFIGIPTRSGK
jgi:hypothetical protein